MQLNLRSFANVEYNWSWDIRIAISGIVGWADVLRATEAHKEKRAKELLDDVDRIAEMDHGRRMKASSEHHSALARYTRSDAVAIARSVKGLDGVDSVEQTSCHLQLKNDSKNVHGATCMHLPEACFTFMPLEVRDLRLEQIGEHCRTLKFKVISYGSDKDDGGNAATSVPNGRRRGAGDRKGGKARRKGRGERKGTRKVRCVKGTDWSHQ